MRRAAVWAATAWFAIVTSGVPLPAGIAPGKFGTPFPCQMHACGCTSAAACWNDCCCFTRVEKLAWARKHGVNPPAGTPTFEIAAKKESKDEHVASKKADCCAVAETGAPPTLATPPRACCSVAKDAAKSCCSSNVAASDGDETTPKGVVLLQAMKCKGVASSWNGTGDPFVPPACAEWAVESTFSEALAAPLDCFASRRLRYVGPPG